MSDFNCYPASTLFKIKEKKESSFNKKNQPCNFPFNLDFIIYKKNKSCFYGPGIYTITYNHYVIYIGSYSPINEGNVIDQRWKKHIMTMTNRGYRIGFSSKIKRNKISPKFKKYFERDKEFRYSDTGTVTTLERLKFAEKNKLLMKKNNSLINNFEFFYFQLTNYNVYKSKTKLEKLEQSLIEKFKPQCNSLKKGTNPNTGAYKINHIKKDLNKLLETTI